jgi:hypothetical protein
MMSAAAAAAQAFEKPPKIIVVAPKPRRIPQTAPARLSESHNLSP